MGAGCSALASLLNNWIFPVGEEGCASKPGLQSVKIGFSVQPK